MMLALLLAQLVLPWPGRDSPLVQPGPTICVGECAGPVVWGPAERGRLVVACDMRSDTCSDGRRITTTRATPVPCETSPGVWEMVPEDEGCYSVRGLESWAQTTSYLSYGAELDRSPWQAVDGATVQSLPTGGYRVFGTGSNSRIMQPGIPAAPGPHTLSCIARSVDETPQARMRIYWDASSPGSVAIPVTAEWAVHSITATVPEEWDGNISIHVYSRTGTVDVIGCWLTRTDTPGRPCWGGEAPVTCAGDRNRISTEGWPTTEGEISMVAELNEPLSEGRNAWLFDGRDADDLMGVNPYIQPDGRLRFRVAGTVYGSASPMLTWEVGRPYALRFLRKGGRTDIYRDGALVYSVATPDWAWVPSAHLGMNFSLPGPDVATAIRSLTVRRYEEVSP